MYPISLTTQVRTWPVQQDISKFFLYLDHSGFQTWDVRVQSQKDSHF